MVALLRLGFSAIFLQDVRCRDIVLATLPKHSEVEYQALFNDVPMCDLYLCSLILP